jgi:serine/threonine protein kinase
MLIHSAETVGLSGENPAPSPWPVIPGYSIEAEIGRGGMGIVVRARQQSSGRMVALKLLRDAALATPEALARFRREAEAAARLEHASLVKILDVGEHAGQPYYAMELATGGRLDERLSGRPHDPREAAELVRLLADAIDHAHERGVVHRDLKPANIVFRPRSGGEMATPPEAAEQSTPRSLELDQWEPLVADFGLVKELGGESTAWTRDGAILGTASYMAPEQAEGRTADVGPAADIYALGAILYELLTGRPPFADESWSRTVLRVLTEEPVPPTAMAPQVPHDLETICLACLAKLPAERPTSARFLAEELARFLQGEPITIAGRSSHSQLARRAADDGFTLLEPIGTGPQSTVYRALAQPLSQPVAIKVFRAGAISREAWETRLRECGGLWASLSHPQIALNQRAGWWDGAAYVAMEFLPGGSLQSRIGGRPMAAAQVYELMEPLIESVNYLHRQGVVHGNLKPSNVLLAADGIPRIADFRPLAGMALAELALGRETSAEPQADELETAAIGYVAPELLDKPPGELRPYTDIYGLGLILYELLAGRPPFRAETPSEMQQLVRETVPPPPSAFCASVTPQLDGLCLRALRKNPWKRYHRVYDMLAYLRYLREGGRSRNLPASLANPRGRPPRPV